MVSKERLEKLQENAERVERITGVHAMSGDGWETVCVLLMDRLDGISEIIEEGDRRLQFRDGECGGLPPEITLDEWRKMYLLASSQDEDYPECSGDHLDCPENEGYGCCNAGRKE